MTDPCFVDANVFVYAGDPRDAAKQQRAVAWLDLLWQEQRGRTSAQVLSESYVALTRIARANGSNQDVWPSVKKYFVWNPLAIDVNLLRRARAVEERFRISWWDSMVVAAAQVQYCSLLLTEDLQDGMTFGSVTVRSPFTLEVREAAATYQAMPRVASPHRRRGRPRTVRRAEGAA
ncbi:MAG TPA: PIN domain-containing protein [Burkholderiales bacterium]|nr:PIN domain-containing protein [Burkholderiales bacterium]